MKAVQFDDKSGYAILNEDGLCFAVRSVHHWWRPYRPVDLSKVHIEVVDLPEEESDQLITDYCAAELKGEIN